MKLKVTTVQEVEVDLQFPCFYKGSSIDLFYFKVISEDQTIRVAFAENSPYLSAIEITSTQLVFSRAIEVVECESSEFYTALINAKIIIDKLVKL